MGMYVKKKFLIYTYRFLFSKLEHLVRHKTTLEKIAKSNTTDIGGAGVKVTNLMKETPVLKTL